MRQRSRGDSAGRIRDGYRAEFVKLVELAESLTRQTRRE